MYRSAPAGTLVMKSPATNSMRSAAGAMRTTSGRSSTTPCACGAVASRARSSVPWPPPTSTMRRHSRTSARSATCPAIVAATPLIAPANVSDDTYFTRVYKAIEWASDCNYKDVTYERPIYCGSPDVLMKLFLQVEQEHGEGLCFRLEHGRYKQGRSTLKEQLLVKLCRYVRQEVTIIGMEEQFENGNPTHRNAIGMMDRSSMQSELAGKDTLGSFLSTR